MSLRNQIFKKLIAYLMSGWSDGTIEEQRARQEKMARFSRVPADIECQPISVDGVPAEWISVQAADMGVILYLHGGAYALGVNQRSPRIYHPVGADYKNAMFGDQLPVSP